MVNIEELRTAISLSSCEWLHAELTGYCRALHECEIISHEEWARLQIEISNALNERKQAGEVILPWGPEDCRW